MPDKSGAFGWVHTFPSILPILKASTWGWINTVEEYELYRYPGIFGYINTVDLRAFPPYEEGRPVPLSYDLVETPTFNNTEISYERHTERYLEHDDGVRWRFSLNFETLTAVDKQRVLAFFVARKGNHEAFTLVHPLTHEYYPVRFVNGIAEYSLFAHRLYDFQTVDLIQIDSVFNRELEL